MFTLYGNLKIRIASWWQRVFPWLLSVVAGTCFFVAAQDPLPSRDAGMCQVEASATHTTTAFSRFLNRSCYK